MRFDSGALMTLIRSTISFLQSIEARIPAGAPPAGSPAPRPPVVLPSAPTSPPVNQGPEFRPMIVTGGTNVTIALPTTATVIIGEILDEGNPIEAVRTTSWQVVTQPYGAKITYTPYAVFEVTDTGAVQYPNLIATSLSFDYVGGRTFAGGSTTDRVRFPETTGYQNLGLTTKTITVAGRATTIDSTFRRLISKEDTPHTAGWNIAVVLMAGQPVYVFNQAFTQNAPNSAAQWTCPAIAAGSDFHLSVQYSGASTANDPVMIVNLTGQTVTERITPVGVVTTDNGLLLILGNRDSTPNRAFAGPLYRTRVFAQIPLDSATLAADMTDPEALENHNALVFDDTPNTMLTGKIILPATEPLLGTTVGTVMSRSSPTFGPAVTNTGTYVFRLVGTSEFQFHERTNYLVHGSNVTVTVNSLGNVAPVVDAGTNLTITLPATGVVVGTVTDDGLPASPGTTTSTWSQLSGEGTITFSTTANLSASVTASTHGTYHLQLAASDGALGAADTMIFTVNPQVSVNVAPTVELGPSLSVVYPATAIVIGTVADDGLPNPPGALTLTWSRVSGPGTITFSNTAATTTSLTFSTSGNYVIQLLAADSLLSGSDQMVASVFPPIASQGTLILALNRSITF